MEKFTQYKGGRLKMYRLNGMTNAGGIIFAGAVCICGCVLLTACSAENESGLSADAETLRETSAVQTETDSGIAKRFADMVYDELQNNKTSDDPTTFAPISIDHEIPESGFDTEAFTADMILLDINSDGIPELFTGGHGAIGTGRYTVYSADEGSYGNSTFSWSIDGFRIVDGDMYVSSGSNSYWGWVKLCSGLPSIHFNGSMSETGSNVDVKTADGSEKSFSDITLDDVRELYNEYLGVDFDKLQCSDDNPGLYVRDTLRVPDPDNYTAEDIYSCLAPLVERYEALENAVRGKMSELNRSDAPFEVSGIYEGTSFDFNGDGIDDRVFGFALYSQFEFVIFDGKTADIMLDERVMEDIYSSELAAEVYSDSLGNFRFKIGEKSAKTAASEITETIQIFPDADPMILEAVYDKETGEFIHAYDKYTLDEYTKKQAELLEGYELYRSIDWQKCADIISGTENCCKWSDKAVSAFLGTLDDAPERYYNFADIDNDGLDEMLMADNYLWAVKPLSDTEFDKKLVSVDPLGGYASVAYGRPSADADIYKSDDYSSWYTPNLDIYIKDDRFYISGVHISAAAPYHIGWISEVKFDNEKSAYYLEPLYTWGYTADTALSFDGHIYSEHSADAEKFFADAVSVSGKNYSKVIHDLARIYTDKIMEKLADGSAEDGFAPIASGTDTSVGTQALNSVLYLADTEFDGVPELFAGVSGTVGAGKYDFYSQDGTLFGTIICRAGLDCGKAVDGAVYIDSGRNSYPGWTKLTAGCPSIHITDFTDFDGADNDVDIAMSDGTEKRLTGLTFDDVKALYPEYLGVDYDVLAEPPAGAEYNCLEGTLAVPDPDNYTEEDIYSCIEKLLNEYDKKFGIN